GWGRGILPNQKVFFRVSLGNSDAFEAMYEVRTFGPSSVSAELLIARPLDVGQMWRTRQASPPSGKAMPSPGKPDEAAQ
ncbi:hypothetical protein, partial [Pseudomonas sp. FW301-21D1A]